MVSSTNNTITAWHFSKTENFQQYTKSCNKYHHKIDHVIKDILSPKSILLRNRRYDEKENNLISFSSKL